MPGQPNALRTLQRTLGPASSNSCTFTLPELLGCTFCAFIVDDGTIVVQQVAICRLFVSLYSRIETRALGASRPPSKRLPRTPKELRARTSFVARCIMFS